MSCSWEMDSDGAACPLGKLGPHSLSDALQWQVLRSSPVVVACPTDCSVSLTGPDRTAAGCAAGCNAASGHRPGKGKPDRLMLQQRSAGLHSSRADPVLPIALRAEACPAQSCIFCRRSSQGQHVPPLLCTQARAAGTLLALVTPGQVTEGRS